LLNKESKRIGKSLWVRFEPKDLKTFVCKHEALALKQQCEARDAVIAESRGGGYLRALNLLLANILLKCWWVQLIGRNRNSLLRPPLTFDLIIIIRSRT
jgi:hypothetical protein